MGEVGHENVGPVDMAMDFPDFIIVFGQFPALWLFYLQPNLNCLIIFDSLSKFYISG